MSKFSSLLHRKGGLPRLLQALIMLLLLAIPPGNLVRAAELVAAPQIERRLYVPFDQLNLLLSGAPRRVLISSAEYEELLAQSQRNPALPPPQNALVSSASYQLNLAQGRASLRGELTVQVLEAGLQALPLDLSGVALQAATLDGKPAPLTQRGGQVLLLVNGKGEHQLRLEMFTPLTTSSAHQMLSFRVPQPPAATWQAQVEGDVELRGGAAVIRRQYDAQAKVTHLNLLPPRGQVNLLLSLNSHMQQTSELLIARSVMLDELTLGFERLHARISFQVLHRAVEQLRLRLPDGFEIAQVDCPLLSRWAVIDSPEGRLLEVRLRQAVADRVDLSITAVAPARPLEKWTLPRLEPLAVAGHVAMVGLLLDQRLQAQDVSDQNLIAVDPATIDPAVQQVLAAAEPGSPPLRLLLAYYAPQSDYGLSARFVPAPSALRVVSSLLLRLQERSVSVVGGLSLSRDGEKLFGFDLLVPPHWRLDSLRDADGSSLPYELVTQTSGATLLHVRLPQPAAPRTAFAVHFEAQANPEKWLENWTSTDLSLPVFAVAQAAEDSGVIAIAAQDDLAVRPGTLEGLTPLDEKEKAGSGLAGMASDLAYRYDAPGYSAQLLIERVPPRLTARTYSFFRVQPGVVAAHYELHFQVQQARTQRLSFLLPESTPSSVSIAGLDGVIVKESVANEAPGGMRRWTAILQEKRRGVIRLSVDLEQPVEMGQDAADQRQAVLLPLPRCENVAYESGLAAVEGSAELDVQVATHPRKVDEGELVDAEYQVGRRLLGVYAYVGDLPKIELSVALPPQHPLPASIVQSLVLRTQLSAGGVAQSEATFHLRTAEDFLQLELPGDSELWSAVLDGVALKPQRQGERLLLSLPPRSGDRAGAVSLRALVVTYQTRVEDARFWSTLGLHPPRLLVKQANLAADVDAAEPDAPATQPAATQPAATQAAATQPAATQPAAAQLPAIPTQVETFEQPVPVADLNWSVYLPDGYSAVAGSKDLAISGIEQARPWVLEIPGWLWKATGGFVGPLPLRGSPRRSARQSQHSLQQMSQRRGMVLSDEYRESEDQQPSQFSFQSISGVTAPAEMAAPTAGPAPVLADAVSSRKSDLLADLGGVRSLHMELNLVGQFVYGRSLGGAPQLELTLVHDKPLASLAWGLGMLVFLIGAVRGYRSWRKLLIYVAAVALLSALLPLLLNRPQWTVLLNGCLLASLLLLPWRALQSLLVKWRAHARRSIVLPAAPATPGLILLTLLLSLPLTGAAPAQAADQPAPPAQPLPVAPMPLPTEANLTPDDLLALLRPQPPVAVPDEVLIFPYDPAAPRGLEAADKVLLPYSRYVSLWQLAHPDRPLELTAAPAPFALAGAELTAALRDEAQLTVLVRLTVEVYDQGVVEVPLPLGDAVLAAALLDGQPARLSMAQTLLPDLAQWTCAALVAPAPTAPVDQAKGQQAAQMDQTAQVRQALLPAAGPPPPAQGFLVVHVQGVGKHQLDLTVQAPLTREGGWRSVAARLPAAVASKLILQVPQAQTEIQLEGLSDRRSYQTQKPDQTIETALQADGALHLRWRGQVTAGQIDQSLTVESLGLLDVQEEGLRLSWQVALHLRRPGGQAFRFVIPAGYLVEEVTGENVRGWELSSGDKQQKLEVTLLKAAGQSQSMIIRLWRPESLLGPAQRKFTAPVVAVEDAALQSGTIAIRRSALVDVQTPSVSGAARTDWPDAAVKGLRSGDTGPLGLANCQAYRFSATLPQIELATQGVSERPYGSLRTILRLAERQRQLECRVTVADGRRKVYRLRLALPKELVVEQVTCGKTFEWSLAQESARQVLNLYVREGASSLEATVSGRLGENKPLQAVALPRIEVLDVTGQSAQVAVQSDPAYDVQAADVVNCGVMPIKDVAWWIPREQMHLVRLALSYGNAMGQATFRLVARKPEVSCYSVTNVRVTDRAVEETILLDFNIQRAGIREVRFLLPAWMKDARISVPLLRLKTVTPVADNPAMVLVVLELQDEVMAQLRVLVENDRLLTSAQQEAPFAVVQTGQTTRRYLTMESAGRDEVVAQEKKNLEEMSRQQKDWQRVADLVQGSATQAFAAEGEGEEPRYVYQVKERQALETAAAQIYLAQTVLAMDLLGQYRAEQTYRMNNTAEQFLEIELPPGAQLWTAVVAGEPVKPAESPTGGTRRLRIALVKTAAGDLDYPVVLKYGGVMTPPGALRKLSFPLIRTVNIQVDLSQVRLLLPEQCRWLDFGGTMRRVRQAGEMEASFLSYQTKQTQQLLKAIQTKNEFAQARATTNLKALQSELEDYQRSVRGLAGSNERLQRELATNSEVLRQAQEQAQQIEQAPEREAAIDNRFKLGELYQNQAMGRSKNVVIQKRAEVAEKPKVFFNADDKAAKPAGGKAGQGAADEKSKDSPALAQKELAESPVQDKEQLRDLDTQVNKARRYQQKLEAKQQVAQPQQPQQQAGEMSGARLGLRGSAPATPPGAPTPTEPAASGNAAPVNQPAGRSGGDRDEGRWRGTVAWNDSHVGWNVDGQQFDALAAAPGQPTGLASLDVELPFRGVEYRFTTPRGQLEITARAVRSSTLERWGYVGLVLLLAALLALVLWGARRWGKELARPKALIAALIVSATLLILGVVPVLSLLVLLITATMTLGQWRNRRRLARLAA